FREDCFFLCVSFICDNWRSFCGACRVCKIDDSLSSVSVSFFVRSTAVFNTDNRCVSRWCVAHRFELRGKWCLRALKAKESEIRRRKLYVVQECGNKKIVLISGRSSRGNQARNH
ncbi:hypothetical protein CpipJ_CPIJ005077, partial [Culex quinquefasciatus]